MLSRHLSVNLFIRSLLFSISSVTLIIVYGLICGCSMVLPLHYRHSIIRSFLRSYMFLLKHLCQIDYQVQGRENVPKDRNGIILSKHQSACEAFFMPLIFRDPAVIVKRELLWVPFFGWGLAAASPISINRSDKTSSMQQIIAQGQKVLEEGRWILIFPEGTRIPYGEVGKYRLGGARLAAVTGYPVIPVAHDAGRFWPKRSFIKYPGTVRVIIGPLIETVGRTPEEILSETQNWIEDAVKRIDGLFNEAAR